MSDEKRTFCYHCGANLPDNSVYCPECGQPVNPTSPPNPESYDTSRTPMSSAPSRGLPLDSYLVFILLYALLALFMGLTNLYTGLNVSAVEQMFEMLIQMGYDPATLFGGLTPQEIADTALMGGSVMTASGACALVSFIVSRKRILWPVAVGACALATVLSIGLMSMICIVTVAVGAFNTYQIYKSKDGFVSKDVPR